MSQDGTGPAQRWPRNGEKDSRWYCVSIHPELAGLPWEAMYDAVDGAYVCRRDQLVRHVPVASVMQPLKVQPPLRILGIVSSPRGLPPLDVEHEQEQLTRVLARPCAEGLIEVHWAAEATWAALQDLLLGGQWHVVHFIGHGDFDVSQDEGLLALTRDDSRPDMVEADRLVDLLHEARPMPRLVVLNSCSGGCDWSERPFRGHRLRLGTRRSKRRRGHAVPDL